VSVRQTSVTATVCSILIWLQKRDSETEGKQPKTGAKRLEKASF